MRAQTGLSGTADLGRRDVARKQGQRSLAGEIEPPFEAGMDAAEKPAQTGDALRLVLDQFTAAADLERFPADVNREGIPSGAGA